MSEIYRYKWLCGLLSCFFLIGLFASPLMAEEAIDENDKDAPAAYWVDPDSGEKIDTLQVPIGGEKVVRLQAEIPEDKTLKAYSFELLLEEDALIEISDVAKIEDAELPPMNININEDGEVFVNAFAMKGVEGEAIISVVDVNIKGFVQGTSYLSTLFTAYGPNAVDQFLPEIEPLTVEVK